MTMQYSNKIFIYTIYNSIYTYICKIYWSVLVWLSASSANTLGHFIVSEHSHRRCCGKWTLHVWHRALYDMYLGISSGCLLCRESQAQQNNWGRVATATWPQVHQQPGWARIPNRCTGKYLCTIQTHRASHTNHHRHAQHSHKHTQPLSYSPPDSQPIPISLLVNPFLSLPLLTSLKIP